MLCVACNFTLKAGTRFCPQCGSPVAPDRPVVPLDPLQASLESALAGQYKIVRLLGRGGMGAVYLGREHALDRLVAIKVLPPERGETPESRERFRREARMAAKLTHPNIAPLHTFGEVGGMMYYAMGYVRGESLAARMRREGKLPIEESRRILAEIADALDYAHRQGIVHRDIKPDNVLIDDESGRAMLTDFGVAKGYGTAQTLTQVGGIVGTPHYMSPEQASGKSTIDGRSDLYSLGVMGYAMLSGRLPFEGESPRDILVKHLTEDPPPLKILLPSMPDSLAATLTRCLAKEPAARWPDCKSFRDAIAPARGVVEELPDELTDLQGKGFWLLLCAIAAVFLAGVQKLWLGHIDPMMNLWIQVLELLPLFFFAVLLNSCRTARSKELAWSEIRRVVFWSPAWWPFWYPRGLRRPGDVWDRLPAQVRRLRLASTSVLVFFFGCMLPFMIFSFSPAYIGNQLRLLSVMPVLRGIVVSLFVLAYIWIILELWICKKWLNRSGLGFLQEDYSRVLMVPTTKTTFWQRPEIARLLMPPKSSVGGSVAGHEPQSPYDHLQAILQVAQGFTGPFREIGSESVAAARHLLQIIETIDHVIEGLSRDVGAEEAPRIEQKLAELGTKSESEGEARRQMRQLLGSQLELVRRVATQLDAAKARRAQLLDLLKKLWVEVIGLRSRSPEETFERAVTAHVRAICAEVERRAGEATGRHLGHDSTDVSDKSTSPREPF